MSIASIFKAVMQRFSYGETVYLRTYSLAESGSEDLYPADADGFTDIPLDHVPKVRKLRAEDVVSPDNISIGDIRVLLFFGLAITESVFDAASGIVIGGTYDGGTSQVTGGKFYPIRKESVTKLFTDSYPASGAEFDCAYKGAEET